MPSVSWGWQAGFGGLSEEGDGGRGGVACVVAQKAPSGGDLAKACSPGEECMSACLSGYELFQKTAHAARPSSLNLRQSIDGDRFAPSMKTPSKGVSQGRPPPRRVGGSEGCAGTVRCVDDLMSYVRCFGPWQPDLRA